MREAIGKRFCQCIKKVRKTIKTRRGTKEQAAIAVCVKSVLHSKKKTLAKRFTCRNKVNVKLQRYKEINE
jgi:hypothetical protein